jgi:hypothetical protein
LKTPNADVFKIDVATETLVDLRRRLASTRWSCPGNSASWDAGTDAKYLRELIDYWRDAYDWEAQQETLNQSAHFRAGIDDVGIHFIHERGNGPKPFPIILTHGYPDSFYRFAKIIPMLTDPESFGGTAEDAFDVVVPDLQGTVSQIGPPKMGQFLTSAISGPA